MTTAHAERAPEFPPGVDGRALLRPAAHTAVRLAGEGGARYRRAITAADPFLFGVIYLGPYLRNQVTGLMSFSQLHLDLCDAARSWGRPLPRRDVWVAPRGGAKTTWLFLVLPLWALAHGHRSFFLAFSYTADQAEFHLADLRTELATNELLRADFPELAPRRGANTKRTILTGGATIAARGLGGTNLGIKSGHDRPDLIVGDDLEPGHADHTPERKAKIEAQIMSDILPMGSSHAVVQLAGTTTMEGSLIHDAVRSSLGEAHAPWLVGHRFAPHYYPAIIDEGTPEARSLWPQAWPLSKLLADRDLDPSTFALNMQNRPEQAGVNGWWTRELIRYDSRIEVTRRVLYADVAMTQNARSDQTALVLLGVSRDGRRAVVEHAEAGRWRGIELRERMWALTEAVPRTLKEWIIESNQGGDRWREIVSPIPPGVRLDLEHVTGSKRSRLEVALKAYQRGAVVHSRPHEQLETQQLAWTPQATADDLLDALAGALRRVFP